MFNNETSLFHAEELIFSFIPLMKTRIQISQTEETKELSLDILEKLRTFVILIKPAIQVRKGLEAITETTLNKILDAIDCQAKREKEEHHTTSETTLSMWKDAISTGERYIDIFKNELTTLMSVGIFKLLSDLPKGLPQPDYSVDSDGKTVSLDWSKDGQIVFSICLSSDHSFSANPLCWLTVHWSYFNKYIPSKTSSGTFKLNNNIPKEVMDLANNFV